MWHRRHLSAPLLAVGFVSGGLAFTPPARAATGPASLACAARAPTAPDRASPPLTLKGLIPATEPALNLTLADGASELKLQAEAGDQVRVIAAWADQRFTLTVIRKAGGPPLRLYARPATVTVRKEPFALHARFEAVLIQAPRPSPGAGPPLRAVKMTCQYDYEV
jgi:hypothetical protein